MICQSINDSFFTADTIITLQHCTLTWKEEFIFTYKSTQSILNKFIKVQIKKIETIWDSDTVYWRSILFIECPYKHWQ